MVSIDQRADGTAYAIEYKRLFGKVYVINERYFGFKEGERPPKYF